MKKTYLNPAMLTVELGTVKMLAESVTISSSSSEGNQIITNEQQFLTNENRSIWDETW